MLNVLIKVFPYLNSTNTEKNNDICQTLDFSKYSYFKSINNKEDDLIARPVVNYERNEIIKLKLESVLIFCHLDESSTID